MFFDSYDEQFAHWKKFRSKLEKSQNPYEDTLSFWAKAPLVNKNLDTYRADVWPDPWQIIKDGKYCDLTIAVMIGHTLQLTKRFSNSQIQIKTYLDTGNKTVYNTCSIDNKILNYRYGEAVNDSEIPDSVVLQSVVDLPSYR